MLRAILLVGIATSAAGAQGAPGSIVGSVVDSLHVRTLSGGSVVLTQQGTPTGTAAAVVAVPTTADGLFSVDSLPAGRYAAALAVPELDSLGIALAPLAVDVVSGRPTRVTIALPSLTTVTGQSCPTGSVALKRGMIVGRVLDGSTGQPLAGARVVVQWTDVWFDQAKGIRQAVRVRYSAATKGGVFRVCDVPTILTLLTQAQVGERSSPAVDLQLGPSGIARQDFTVASESAAPQSATLVGKVRNADGQLLPNVDVAVLATPAIGRTTAAGEFKFDHLPTGTLTVEARQIGYLPERVPIRLVADSARTVTITLARRTEVLDSIIVYAKKKYDLSEIKGFDDRRHHLHGTFLDSAQIADRVPVEATDVLRDIPGIELDWTGSDYVITSTRGTKSATQTCSPTLYVDNINVQDINWVEPADMKAVEVYASPIDAPAEFAKGRGSACGIVVIWTRPGGTGATSK
jgi:hypothetical protein